MGGKGNHILMVILIGGMLFGFCLWSLLKAPDRESLTERRQLSAFPEMTKEAVLSGRFMNDFENYALDQFPLRDSFRSVKAMVSRYGMGQKDNNGVYLQDGYLAKLDYPLNEQSVSYAARRFAYLYDRYLAGKNMKIYLSVVPDKGYFLAEAGGYPAMDYRALFHSLQAQMPYAEYIDLLPYLELSDYYRTDSHWRQEKIIPAAEYLAGRMGASGLRDIQIVSLDCPFYGVYYGQMALTPEPDQIFYADSPTLRACSVYDYETGSWLPVYDLEKGTERDPYQLFLSGSRPLLTLENPNAKTKRELILFRDSFGSAIAPLLAESYQKITLVDIRYVSPEILDKWICFQDQDILFLYSASVLNDSVTIK